MIIVDTNILLQKDEILDTTDVDLYIPLSVICELNELKKKHDKAGYIARNILQKLKEMFVLTNSKIYKTENGCKIEILTSDDDSYIIANKLGSVDFDIIKKAIECGEILRTSDIALSLCAIANGCKVIFDDIITDNYKGYTEYYAPKEIVDLLSKGETVKTDNMFYSNEFVICKDITNIEHIAIGRFNIKNNTLVPIKYKVKFFGIEPMPKNIQQTMLANLLMDPEIKIITVKSQAGAGKTILTLASALEQTNSKKPLYDKILVLRGLNPVAEDIGYLPGDKDEKIDPWYDALYDSYDIILKKNGYIKEQVDRDYLKQVMKTHKIEIGVLSFVRGRSIQNSFIIVDEAQNIKPEVMRTILTRCAEGSKIVILGDPSQIDNKECSKKYNGLVHVISSLYDKWLPEYAHIDLEKCERSRIADIGISYL